MRLGYALRATQVAAALLVTAAPAIAQTPVCETPANIVRLNNTLPRVAMKLAAGQPITIVAIGSSSTAGAGASTPANSYPSRLQVFLSEQFPRQKFNVINRGVNGEEIKEMLTRLDSTVLSEKPDLVLWQLGTNSVLRDHPTDQGCRDPRRHQPDQARRRRRRADRSAVCAEGDCQDAMHEHGGDDRHHREVRERSGVPAL